MSYAFTDFIATARILLQDHQHCYPAAPFNHIFIVLNTSQSRVYNLPFVLNYEHCVCVESTVSLSLLFGIEKQENEMVCLRDLMIDKFKLLQYFI